MFPRKLPLDPDPNQRNVQRKIECRAAFARAAEACIDNRYSFVRNLGASLLHANGAARRPIRREAATSARNVWARRGSRLNSSLKLVACAKAYWLSNCSK